MYSYQELETNDRPQEQQPLSKVSQTEIEEPIHTTRGTKNRQDDEDEPLIDDVQPGMKLDDEPVSFNFFFIPLNCFFQNNRQDSSTCVFTRYSYFSKPFIRPPIEIRINFCSGSSSATTKRRNQRRRGRICRRPGNLLCGSRLRSRTKADERRFSCTSQQQSEIYFFLCLLYKNKSLSNVFPNFVSGL